MAVDSSSDTGGESAAHAVQRQKAMGEEIGVSSADDSISCSSSSCASRVCRNAYDSTDSEFDGRQVDLFQNAHQETPGARIRSKMKQLKLDKRLTEQQIAENREKIEQALQLMADGSPLWASTRIATLR